jgi:hypothetical protein
MEAIWRYFEQPDFWIAASAGIVVNIAAALLKPERDWLWRRRRASIAALIQTFRPRMEVEPGPPFVLVQELQIKQCRSDGVVYLILGAVIHILVSWLTRSLGVQMRLLLIGMGGCVTVWCVVHATLEFTVAADLQKEIAGAPRPPTSFRGQ